MKCARAPAAATCSRAKFLQCMPLISNVWRPIREVIGLPYSRLWPDIAKTLWRGCVWIFGNRPAIGAARTGSAALKTAAPTHRRGWTGAPPYALRAPPGYPAVPVGPTRQACIRHLLACRRAAHAQAARLRRSPTPCQTLRSRQGAQGHAWTSTWTRAWRRLPAAAAALWDLHTRPGSEHFGRSPALKDKPGGGRPGPSIADVHGHAAPPRRPCTARGRAQVPLEDRRPGDWPS